jgi:uncharacterized membrane protein YidH (DUF202 family)
MIKLIGIVLIVLGMCSVAWGGFTYKTKEKFIDVGPIQATREITHYIPIAPVAGALAVLAGIGLLASRKL